MRFAVTFERPMRHSSIAGVYVFCPSGSGP
jgi:hypothetical protein